MHEWTENYLRNNYLIFRYKDRDIDINNVVFDKDKMERMDGMEEDFFVDSKKDLIIDLIFNNINNIPTTFHSYSRINKLPIFKMDITFLNYYDIFLRKEKIKRILSSDG